MASLPTWILL